MSIEFVPNIAYNITIKTRTNKKDVRELSNGPYATKQKNIERRIYYSTDPEKVKDMKKVDSMKI